jgi:CRP/FNR family transcriptional regulator
MAATVPTSIGRTRALRVAQADTRREYIASNCSRCSFGRSCLPAGLPPPEQARLESLIYMRRRVKRGEALYHQDDPLRSLYAIRAGSFKTVLVDANGREQLTGFFIGGELLGTGGLASGRYATRAVALEDSEVCVLPHSLLEQLSQELPALQRYLCAVLAREIVRNHGTMMLLGSMSAGERLAAFLLELSSRYARRGFSPSNIHLRMTRAEIGSYLGQTLETVSRQLARFEMEGLIEVDQRHVRILDVDGLSRMHGG